jgi:hypothetical protein
LELKNEKIRQEENPHHFGGTSISRHLSRLFRSDVAVANDEIRANSIGRRNIGCGKTHTIDVNAGSGLYR